MLSRLYKQDTLCTILNARTNCKDFASAAHQYYFVQYLTEVPNQCYYTYIHLYRPVQQPPPPHSIAITVAFKLIVPQLLHSYSTIY